MDFNTWTGIIRAVAPAIVAFAVGKGWLTGANSSGIVDAIAVGIPAIAAAIWSIFTNIKSPTPIPPPAAVPPKP